MAGKKAKERTVRLSCDSTGMEFTVLGLDCSSSTVGWGLVGCGTDGTFALLAHGHIKPLDSKHGLFERLDDLFERIGQLCETLSPTHVALEDIFTYVKGKSTAKTITILAAFNRVAGLSVHRKNGGVLLYSVNRVRPLIRKAYSVTAKIEKQQLPDLVRRFLEPGFGDILDKNGNVSKITYDESDGIAVAWACALDIRSRA